MIYKPDQKNPNLSECVTAETTYQTLKAFLKKIKVHFFFFS